MTFVKTSPKIKVGDTVSLTKKIESLSGYFPEGSILKVIDIDTRGYSFEDEDGSPKKSITEIMKLIDRAIKLVSDDR